MNKTTIIETQNSNMEYDNKRKGVLGVLKGIFADYKNGTRNGGRLYTEELWDNRVFGSQDVMEALNTKTLFGELDHPEGDRCETLAQNAAISIVKLEKRPEEGVIYGEAEILDTPTGRIVKALADSGAKLGISSRGMGEEIFDGEQNIIDPETYDFITFDVVVTPANEKARVQLSESKHINKLTENLKKEIKESETENQLNQIKTVLESVKLNNKELDEMISAKLEKLNTTKVSVRITEANRRLVIEQLTKSLENKIAENKQLKEQNEYYKESKQLLQTKLNENINNKELEEKDKAIESLQKQLEETNKTHNESLNGLKKVYNKKLENKEETLKEKEEEINKLNENNKVLEENNIKLQESKDQLSKILMNNKNLQEANKKINEEKEKLLKENNELKTKLKTQSNKIVESKKQEETKVQKLEKEIQRLQEANNRLSDVSFTTIGQVQKMEESNQINNNWSEEEKALFNMMVNGNC